MMDNSSIPFDECLWQAYVSTTYRILVTAETFWDVHIDRFHPQVDHFLRIKKLESWVFISAWNPGSQLLETGENQQRNQELLKTIQQKSTLWFPGLGIGQSGDWPPEESYWVAGIPEEQAVAWGKEWEQNAVVWARLGEKATLLVTL